MINPDVVVITPRLLRLMKMLHMDIEQLQKTRGYEFVVAASVSNWKPLSKREKVALFIAPLEEDNDL